MTMHCEQCGEDPSHSRIAKYGQDSDGRMFNKKSRGIEKKVFLDFITKEEDMPMRKRKSLMVSSLNDVIARNGEELEIISVRILKT